MVDPIVTKSAVKPSEIAGDKNGTATAKTSESRFDKVRANLQDEQARAVQIPPEINKISTDQQKALKADLTKRLHKTSVGAPHDIFKTDMQTAKQKLQHITDRVNALPKTSAFDPLRQRLASIDSQYRATGNLMNNTKGSSPSDLLKIQIQLYQVSENLEVMSKVVEQVTSGMKTILQTQL